jgi:hypothetical protein
MKQTGKREEVRSMFDRTFRTNRSILGGMLTGVLTVLFVMAFAFPAFAFSTGATPFAYCGKVIAIDNAYRILTMQAGPNDQQIFSMNTHATVSKCGELESFSNLKIGDEVTVSYYQTGDNNNVADDVSLVPSGMMGQHC